ncbi:zinc-binding dehydrogenase [Nitrospirillum sp. BR 11163]|uniref:zinc-binding dehydrogenase n=1 Tax=Nitrospirillum sp. BR 11163 TaxID=3104323 RepID=UPI002AFE6190|nr:zinc-binding dehydrogenase [Nitrospirillum sp. BR 11163]MEA1673625.1 zinc-binding dehydrogenase [Nitrospirillum sp. BR 11163]
MDRLTGGKGFELVYDTNGGAVLDASFQAVARFRHVVSALGWGSHALAPLLTGVDRAHHGEILAQVTTLVEAGKLLPRLDPRAYTLDGVAEAHAGITDHSAKGKIVVSIA